MSDEELLLNNVLQTPDKKGNARPEEFTFQPEAIYFDTNALRRGHWPKGNAQLQQIMQYAEWFGIKLCLPEVVRQELEGHWIRTVENQWKNTNSNIAALTGMLKPLREIDGLSGPPSREDLKDKFEQDSWVLTDKMVLVPLTKRPLSDFVNMAIFREVAFDDSGRGFRDSVIVFSILEHMVATGYTTGVLVSDDDDFQKANVPQLARTSKVDLRLLRTLDELESLLKKNRNAEIRKFIEQQHERVMEALNQRLPDLEDYIIGNLIVEPRDLKVGGTIKKIESLQVIGVENAHEGFYGFEEQPTEPTRVKVSADVKIRLSINTERYSWPEPTKMKVGGGVVPPTDSIHNALTAMIENKIEQDSKFCDTIAVVEAEATKTDTGYSDLRFTSVYLKPSASGFGSFHRLFVGLK